MAFAAIADAANAIKRLQDVFEAELITETHIHDPSLSVAIEIKDASFTWDSPPPDTTNDKKSKRASKNGKHEPYKQEEASGDAANSSTSEKGEEKVFRLEKINVEVPRGVLLAIVGRVGVGKSSLLQGMIGEMRKTEGTVKFGGSVAYCAQNAWIQVSGCGDSLYGFSSGWRLERDSSGECLFWTPV
jgi:ABC-type bacteriocin/lantibiotic exporter with double-glycine peptidase domain